MSPSLVLPRADALKLDSGKMYFVQNQTDKPLTLPDGRTPLLRYARIVYPVAPGQKVIIPFSVMALIFGDPRSRNGMIQKFSDSNGQGMIQSREAELARIAVFWGVYEQGVDTLASVIPDVAFFTLEGQEIIPPCFDPWGEYTYGFDKGEIDTQQGAAAQIAQMRDQMDHLQEQIEAMANGGGDNDADIPEDLPFNHPAHQGGVPAPASL